MRNRRTAHQGMSDAVREDRKSGIGGSDARIIMSGDQRAIERLWQEKRREIESEDLSDNLLVQLGNVTEDLNADWFEKRTGYFVTDEQTRHFNPDWPVMQSTLDGLVRESLESPIPMGVFEGKFMLPFYWTIENAVEKYYAQVQHNMMVTKMERSWLSVITGGGTYDFRMIEADPFYQRALWLAEQEFWEAVQNGHMPGVPDVPVPQAEPVRIDDMTGHNEWGHHASIIIETHIHVENYKKSEKEIKALISAEAKEAFGHGVRLKRSKDNKLALSIDGVKKGRAKKEAA